MPMRNGIPAPQNIPTKIILPDDSPHSAGKRAMKKHVQPRANAANSAPTKTNPHEG
jgi:hypothetical protein